MTAVAETIPVITDPGAAVEWVLDRGRPLDAAEAGIVLARVGRNPAVGVLTTLYLSEMLTDGAFTAHIAGVWSSAEFPLRQLHADDWRELFHAAGYTVDGKPATPPDQLTLYRGATYEARLGWSWTTDIAVARKFGSGEYYSRPAGAIWVAEVEGGRLLAQINDRDESEYVVYTDGLAVSELIEPPAVT